MNMLETKSDKVNLLGLAPAKMVRFFESIGEKRFRAHQVLKWIHHHGVTDISEMSNISRPLREKLKHIAKIEPPVILQQLDSSDGTRKFLIKADGANAIETVFIPENGRGTLCVSSQVGCSLDCSFCATGKQGFNRDLSSAEIIGQLWLAAHSFGQFEQNASRVVTNIVFMGMGEPLLNFDNVMDSVAIMMDDHSYGLSKRRVTISTSGVVPAIDQMQGVTDACLAISLHAPNDELRNKLVPLNKKYPISELLDSAERYINQLPDNHRKITIEYTLIDQLNDREAHAHELAELLKNVPVKINLIPFNPFALVDYRRVSNNALKRFQDVLIKAGFTATIRTTRGDDIDAACGQLAGSVNDKTKRQARYQQKNLALNQPESADVVRIIPS